MTEQATTTPSGVSPVRSRADVFFAWMAAITALALVVQIFLAGVGVFGFKSGKLEDASSFDPHRTLGEIIGLLVLLMLIAAIVARTSKAAIWVSVVLLILVEVAQHALASGGEDNKWVGGLHALDGVIILLATLWLHLDSRKRLHT